MIFEIAATVAVVLFLVAAAVELRKPRIKVTQRPYDWRRDDPNLREDQW